MTLGGLALASHIVGMTRRGDENVHSSAEWPWQAAGATPFWTARQENRPACFVSTLCICIVFSARCFFSPRGAVFFVPLAEAVVFAMLASYILSRTLIPTLVLCSIAITPITSSHAAVTRKSEKASSLLLTAIWQFKSVLNAALPISAAAYRHLLETILTRRRRFRPRLFSGALLGSWAARAVGLGQDFFPTLTQARFASTSERGPARAVEEPPAGPGSQSGPIRREIPTPRWKAFSTTSDSQFGIALSYSNNGVRRGRFGHLISLKAGNTIPRKVTSPAARTTLPRVSRHDVLFSAR